ncbi:nuclear transport factor 2 family protein [Novosphingobium flavum]|uniref:Nuclear transport factor 2 family protein n=1 Tax=Novosphingobium aerophilum TaxID=2839843 RepID=A0A7X1KBH4_9SPHN|nr:nuclear transport factor 2 family protein [Novosphingobium aerophilum]MBC2651198.1 nuclear transport factor 2 family protein [Novosphingobium aerophilum]MBC2660755.1 nuclear transport factor 2 family protein [Novosphingobium aerophilum]
MRQILIATAALVAALSSPAAAAPKAAGCRLTPKQVVTRFMDEFYTRKQVRSAFERWVDPGYIQHNPYAATGRAAAVAFLTGFVEQNPGYRAKIHRIIADGNLVAVHSQVWMKEGDNGSAVVDILRVEGCRVMEHWDVLQPVPEQAANSNGMF